MFSRLPDFLMPSSMELRRQEKKRKDRRGQERTGKESIERGMTRQSKAGSSPLHVYSLALVIEVAALEVELMSTLVRR